MNSNSNNKGRSGSNRIPLPTIIAHNSTEQAQRLITTKFGYPRARNVKELELRLAQIIKTFPDGLKSVSQIHPDKDLILEHNAVRMMEGGKVNGYFNSTGLPPDIVYVPSYSGTEPTLMAVEDWGDVRIKKIKGGYEGADGAASNKISDIIGAGTIILSVLALGTAIVVFGEVKKSLAHR